MHNAEREGDEDVLEGDGWMGGRKGSTPWRPRLEKNMSNAVALFFFFNGKL